MTTTFNKTALAGLAGVMAMTAAAAAPSVAAAQSSAYYGGGNTYSYDPCRRDTTTRGTTGALIGGALGAVIGSNAAARNARTEGALLGGALGALGGAAVGKNSAACQPGSYQPRSSYNNGSYNSGYGSQYAPAPAPGYYDRGAYNGYPDDRYSSGSARYGYAHDRRGNSYSISDRPAGADGCTLAESPIYLPDGQVQKRFVRVCQDADGNYQVVN